MRGRSFPTAFPLYLLPNGDVFAWKWIGQLHSKDFPPPSLSPLVHSAQWLFMTQGVSFKLGWMQITYVRHHNLLLITKLFLILTIQRTEFLWKSLLENKKIWGLNIQAVGYNRAHTVGIMGEFRMIRCQLVYWFTFFMASFLSLLEFKGKSL